MSLMRSSVAVAALLGVGLGVCTVAWSQAPQSGQSAQGMSAQPPQGGHANRPQPAVIVDADALIRAGQRANAAEEAAARPQLIPSPPRPSPPAQQSAKKKKGVHLSTGQPLPLNSDNAGQPTGQQQ